MLRDTKRILALCDEAQEHQDQHQISTGGVIEISLSALDAVTLKKLKELKDIEIVEVSW